MNPSKTASIAYQPNGIKTVEASVAFDQGKLYFGALDGWFCCIDASNGKLLKSIELGAPIYSSASFNGDAVFVSDLAGNLYSFQK